MTGKTPKFKTLAISATAMTGVFALLALANPALAGHRDHGEGMKDRHKAHLEEVDTNNDGSFSKAEVEAAEAKRFAVIDTNGDGSISLGEFEAEKMKRMKERMKKKFDKRDKNGDGVLTADEVGRMGNHFEEMDLDGDGEISKAERKSAHKKMRGDKHKHGKHHKHGE